MFPFIRVTSSILIPTYYFVVSAAIILALFWITARAKKYNLSHKITLDLSLIIMVCGFIGARLLHVFYENFAYYQEDYSRVLYFWDGGFVFFGGALLAALFGVLFLEWKAPNDDERYLDLFAPVISLTYAIGRLGCLFAGCCYGKSCELPWAISGRHPTQIYASIWELGVVLILIGIESISSLHRRPALFRRPGSIFYLWMILHGLGRLLMESFREDFRGPSLGLSISSWISLAVIALGLVLMFRRKPA
ncbi:prolipoprotein diacylglyceryl transferase [Bdellovibrio svalbardensis]|uniref:Phosphatidylglycerol--prolipoprotein diacylglyceryl transferase n=1 Tax=Bdellovibrio svalbardensis TaxID=2972972 RepID=A0ABT6DEW1_9BACT|nr:prolipoprotein diacylglyceryl transferase [Bdellovibrio svalbardensis]MDG0815378.1 prolipoprotein diacylglyceryl transferase [Bdellovibrio svalbardensis]